LVTQPTGQAADISLTPGLEKCRKSRSCGPEGSAHFVRRASAGTEIVPGRPSCCSMSTLAPVASYSGFTRAGRRAARPCLSYAGEDGSMRPSIFPSRRACSLMSLPGHGIPAAKPVPERGPVAGERQVGRFGCALGALPPCSSAAHGESSLSGRLFAECLVPGGWRRPPPRWRGCLRWNGSAALSREAAILGLG